MHHTVVGVAPARRRLATIFVTGAALLAGVGITLQAALAATSPSSWGSVEAPLPANAWSYQNSGLEVPVCPAAGVCWAIGSYLSTISPSSAAGQILIEKLSGGEWHALEAPLPNNAGSTGIASPGGLACPSTTWCVAVGSYRTAPSSTAELALVDTYSAGSWSAAEAPFPGAGAGLTSVSCASRGACSAIGFTGTPGTASTGFADVLSHGTWTVTNAPGPFGSFSTLTGIACLPAGLCEVVGTYSGKGGVQYPLAGTLSGRTWSVAALPLPANAVTSSSANLSGVSCPAAGACVAVGSYASSQGGQTPLIETLANGTWTAAEGPLAPDDPGNGSSLDAVVCTSASTCTAIGNYRTTAGYASGMEDALSSGKWSVIPAQLPAPTGDGARSYLQGLSCVPPDACVAVGYFAPMATGVSDVSATYGLLESGVSGTWVAFKAPSLGSAPGGGVGAELSGVSCPASSYCVAVGSYAATASNGSLWVPPEVVTTPRLVLAPSTVAPGSTVKASLSGFDAKQPVQVTWRTLTGTVLAKAVTDASGAASATFVAPNVAAGRYRVEASAAGGPIAAATLTIS